MRELLDFNKYATLNMMETIQYGVPSENTREHTCRWGRGNRLPNMSTRIIECTGLYIFIPSLIHVSTEY